MGGLVHGHTTFDDPLNKIGGPRMAEQVAEHWVRRPRRHGMPVDADVWLDMKSGVPFDLAGVHRLQGR